MSSVRYRFSEVEGFLLDAGEKSLTGRRHFVAPASEILRRIQVGCIFPTDKIRPIRTESDGRRLQSCTFLSFLLHPDGMLKVLLKIGQPKGKEVPNDQNQQEPDFGHLEHFSHLCNKKKTNV